jgi:hypothetical protein
MEKSAKTSASKEQEAFSTLLLYIKKEGINPATYLHANEKTIKPANECFSVAMHV